MDAKLDLEVINVVHSYLLKYGYCRNNKLQNDKYST